MMVAAHQGDLHHAARVGMKTAYVFRPYERGPNAKKDLPPNLDFDIIARMTFTTSPINWGVIKK